MAAGLVPLLTLPAERPSFPDSDIRRERSLLGSDLARLDRLPLRSSLSIVVPERHLDQGITSYRASYLLPGRTVTVSNRISGAPDFVYVWNAPLPPTSVFREIDRIGNGILLERIR